MENIIGIIIGLVIIVLGIINLTGNISIMHSYHYKRVKEEDKLPFARLVGAGMVIIGIGVATMGALTYASTLTANTLLADIGNVCLIACFVVGLVLIFYAMFKYNKGIF